MGLRDDLHSEVTKIFRERWTKRAGRTVPESDDLKLGDDAVTLEGTVLYADMDDSTKLVDTQNPSFAAEIYKAYLVCAARIIQAEGGAITAYDGDRIMAVFIGDSKNSDAARTALKINFAVQRIINPAIKTRYPNSHYSVRQVVGIDTSKLFVARTGIRGANDLSMGRTRRELCSQTVCTLQSCIANHSRCVRPAQREIEVRREREEHVGASDSPRDWT